MKEIFKKVEAYGRDFEISNLGAIRYMPLQGRFKNQVVLKRPEDIPMYTKSNKSPYLHITFGRSNKIYIHKIVAEAFLEKPQDNDNKYVLWFIDRNRYNVRADNLIWVTRNEWIQRMSLEAIGRTTTSTGSKKLTKDQVREIRTKVTEGSMVTFLAKEYGVSHTQIKRIVRRENHAYVS